MGFLISVLHKTQPVLESIGHMRFVCCIRLCERNLALASAIYICVIKLHVVSWSFKKIWSMKFPLRREHLGTFELFITLMCISFYSSIEKLNKLECLWSLKENDISNKFCLHYEPIVWPFRIHREFFESARCSTVAKRDNMSVQTATFCVGTINVNHMTDLKAALLWKHMLEYNIDVMCVTESRYAINTDIHTIDGFDIWYKNRLNATGGVIIYTRHNLYASYISFSDRVLLEDQDNIWVSIVQNGVKIALCCVYVTNEGSPRRRYTNETLFTMLLHRYTWCIENGYTVIVAGDFNAHLGDFGPYGIPNSYHTVNQNGGLLLNFLENTRLRNLNSHPSMQGVWTYENVGLNHRSAIDMILYDESLVVKSAYIDDSEYILQVDSDHNMVIGEFYVSLHWREPVPTRNLWRRSISDRESDVFTHVVDAKIEELPTLLDNPYCSLVNTIRETALLYYGRPVWRSPRRPYESKELRGVRRKLRNVKRELKHFPNLSPWERDNFHKRLFQIRVEKRELEWRAEIRKKEKRWDSWIRSPNGIPGRLGDFMRRVKYEPSFKSDLSNNNNMLLQTPEQISKELSDFIQSIYLERFWECSVPPATTVHNSLHNIISEDMNEQLLSPITIQEVNAAIKFLKLGTSSGAMDIIPEALKAVGIESRFVLNRLFQNWLEFGVIPAEAQVTHVTLLHKSGRRDLIQNYRTLSVSCNIFKLFSRILYMRLGMGTKIKFI